jgi:hypothetical protein
MQKVGNKISYPLFVDHMSLIICLLSAICHFKKVSSNEMVTSKLKKVIVSNGIVSLREWYNNITNFCPPLNETNTHLPCSRVQYSLRIRSAITVPMYVCKSA